MLEPSKPACKASIVQLARVQKGTNQVVRNAGISERPQVAAAEDAPACTLVCSQAARWLCAVRASPQPVGAEQGLQPHSQDVLHCLADPPSPCIGHRVPTCKGAVSSALRTPGTSCCTSCGLLACICRSIGSSPSSSRRRAPDGQLASCRSSTKTTASSCPGLSCFKHPDHGGDPLSHWWVCHELHALDHVLALHVHASDIVGGMCTCAVPISLSTSSLSCETAATVVSDSWAW
jgi:hypothetical protein